MIENDSEPIKKEGILVSSVSPSPCPVTLTDEQKKNEILAGADWQFHDEFFTTAFRVINRKILYSTSTGFLQEHHITGIVALREKVCRETCGKSGFDYFIADVTKLEGGYWQARKRYVQSIMEWHETFPFKAFIIYGTNRFMRIAITLARRVLPFKMFIAKSLDEALEIVQAIESQAPYQKSLLPDHQLSQAKNAPDFKPYIDEIMDYLAQFSWDTHDQTPFEASLPHHPFKPVFDALDLLKWELRDLLQERRKAEAANKDSEARYRLIAEQTSDFIVITTFDENPRFTYVSPSHRQLGYEPEELLGKPPLDFVHSEDKERLSMLLIDYLIQAQNDKTTPKQAMTTIEFRFMDKSGEWIDVEATANIIDDKVLLVSRDVTGRKKAEQDRLRMEEQLRMADKMQSIGLLAGGLAHDFNNLLAGIQGYTSLMQLQMEASHPCRSHVKSIELLVNRGAELTGQLLGFARGGKYEVKPTRLDELVISTADMFSRTRKEISIHHDHQTELWLAAVDQGQMDQVMMNLFVNAAHAMPNGGDIFIKTQNVMIDDFEADRLSIRAGKAVRITVEDTGTGIDAAILPKIFDPFFTTREVGKGSGLGLASSYGIIKNHEGAIDVESTPGRGTRFIIIIPATADQPVPGVPVSPSPENHETGTILLVDDEQMIREVVEMMLNHLGFTVVPASSGWEAIQKYQEQKDDIDLILLDMIMPDMTGSQTFDKLKAINPDLRVILTSGYSQDGLAADILRRGCLGFLQKPFGVDVLSRKIHEVLGQSSSMADIFS